MNLKISTIFSIILFVFVTVNAAPQSQEAEIEAVVQNFNQQVDDLVNEAKSHKSENDTEENLIATYGFFQQLKETVKDTIEVNGPKIVKTGVKFLKDKLIPEVVEKLEKKFGKNETEEENLVGTYGYKSSDVLSNIEKLSGRDEIGPNTRRVGCITPSIKKKGENVKGVGNKKRGGSAKGVVNKKWGGSVKDGAKRGRGGSVKGGGSRRRGGSVKGGGKRRSGGGGRGGGNNQTGRQTRKDGNQSDGNTGGKRGSGGSGRGGGNNQTGRQTRRGGNQSDGSTGKGGSANGGDNNQSGGKIMSSLKNLFSSVRTTLENNPEVKESIITVVKDVIVPAAAEAIKRKLDNIKPLKQNTDQAINGEQNTKPPLEEKSDVAVNGELNENQPPEEENNGVNNGELDENQPLVYQEKENNEATEE